MKWRESLREASFRDVPFLVDSHDTAGSRAVAVHEYPGRDLPEFEDLGERGVTFDLEAYVLGTDYMPARDALLAAIRRAGAGTLVHPYLGSFEVVVIDWRLRESTRDGGRADFSIRFLRANDVAPVEQGIDTRQQVRDRVLGAQQASSALFQSVSRLARDTRRTIQAAIERAFAPIEEAIGAAEDWRDTLAFVIAQPAAIHTRLVADVGRITSLADLAPFLVYYGPRSTGDRGQAGASFSTSDRNVATAVRIAATVATCARLAEITFPSYDEAVAARNALAVEFDRRVAEVIDDARAASARLALLPPALFATAALAAQDVAAAADQLYADLRELRTATFADLDARSADLARITRYTAAEVLPALVIAHRLYGPAGIEARSADLVARNALRHPGFVPAARALEVLSD